MKTADELKPELIERIEKFLKTSGGKLNRGNKLGITRAGEFCPKSGKTCCLVGAVLFDNFTGVYGDFDNYVERYVNQAARVLGISCSDVDYLEFGYWEGQHSDNSFGRLGAEMKELFKEQVT